MITMSSRDSPTACFARANALFCARSAYKTKEQEGNVQPRAVNKASAVMDDGCPKGRRDTVLYSQQPGTKSSILKVFIESLEKKEQRKPIESARNVCHCRRWIGSPL